MKRIIFLISLIFLFYKFIFLTPLTYFMRDLEGQFHPWKKFAKEEIIKGNFPYWNPYNFTGIPFLGNIQTQIFTPSSIFFYIFGWKSGLKLFYFFSLFIFGIGFFLLLYKKKLSSFVFILIVFLFNSFQFSQNEFLSGLGTSIWFPFLLFFLLKNNYFFLSLSLTLSFLGGQPQYLLLQIIILLFFINKKRAITLLKAASLSIIFSLPQLIETLIFFKNSYWSNFGVNELTQLSMSFKDFIYFLYPYYHLKKPFFADIYRNPYWIKVYYSGIITLILSFYGIYLYLKKKKFLLPFILIFITMLSLGNNFFLSKFFWKFIKIPLIRYPSRILYISLYIMLFFAFFSFSKIKKFSLKFIIIFLISLDLLIFIKKISFIEYSRIFDWFGKKTSFILKDKENFRIFLTPYTQENRADYVPKERDNLFSNMNILYRFNNLTGQNVEPAEFYRVLAIIQNKKRIRDALPLLKMFNVKYVISMFKLPEDIFEKVISDSYSLYKIKGKFLPRFFVLNRILYNKNVLEKLNEIKKIDFYSDKVKNKKNEEELKISPVKPVSFENDRIKFITEKNGYLVLSENLYPNWKVFLNGRRKKIIPVNVSMRCVKLEEGKNIVVFKYIPVPFIFSLNFLILFSCTILYMGINCILK